MVGGGLMSFLPVTNKAGILTGIYLVNSVVAPLAIFYSVRRHNDPTTIGSILLTLNSGQ